jgi:oleandomycin transport system ATP-binding protein
MDHAIWAEGLVKRFGDTTALAGVDLAVRTGTVLGLLGPNGAGKTTTVRVLATLLQPDAGRATVGGYDVLRDAHLQDAADRAAKTYSGGMRRRLDLAASLVGRPRMLYLDEPTAGLDPRSRMELWDLVRGLVADGVTVLLTTQYLEEADELADEIAVIDHGRVIASGAPDELKAKTGAQSLEVRPADAADLPTVVSVVGELTGTAPEVAGQLVTAPVQDPALLPAAVRRLDDAGVVIGELALRSSSLNEVFLSLTGRPVEETGDDDTEGAQA